MHEDTKDTQQEPQQEQCNPYKEDYKKGYGVGCATTPSVLRSSIVADLRTRQHVLRQRRDDAQAKLDVVSELLRVLTE